MFTIGYQSLILLKIELPIEKPNFSIFKLHFAVICLIIEDLQKSSYVPGPKGWNCWSSNRKSWNGTHLRLLLQHYPENWSFQVELLGCPHITQPCHINMFYHAKCFSICKRVFGWFFLWIFPGTIFLTVLRNTAPIYYFIHIINSLSHNMLLKPNSTQFFHRNCKAATLIKSLSICTENSNLPCS